MRWSTEDVHAPISAGTRGRWTFRTLRGAAGFLVIALTGCGARPTIQQIPRGNPRPPAGTAAPSASNAVGSEPTSSEPITVVLVLDRSGSMAGARLAAVQSAAHAVVDALGEADRIGVLAFDQKASVVVSLSAAGRSSTAHQEINRLSIGRGTDFRQAITDTTSFLRGADMPNVLVLFLSDGQAAYAGVVEGVTALRQQGATLSTIMLLDADRDLLRVMADVGGGELVDCTDLARLPQVMVEQVNRFRGSTPR